MSSLRIAALFGLAMLTIVTAVPAAHAQTTVGTITQSTGAATIQRTGATIGAAQNTPVMLHDKIVTEPNASLTIGLVDNSSLQLGASSTLTIDESVLVNGVGAPSRVGLLGGQLHSIIVGAMRGTSTTFQVNTPNAVGAVRGTDWTENYGEEPRQGYQDCRQFTDVAVQDGTVQACNTATPPECHDVTAGHHTTVACGAFVTAGTGGAAGTAAGAGGLGTLGATALGVGLAGGAGVGIAAAAGAFSSSSSPKPPVSPAL
jgi:hypothetical protein